MCAFKHHSNSRNQIAIALNFCSSQSGKWVDLSAIEHSSLASTRIQLYPAIKALKLEGQNVRVYSLHAKHSKQINAIERSNIVVIGKMSASKIKDCDNMAMGNLAAVAKLKAQGANIVLQYSDHHIIRNDRIGYLYQDLVHLADTIVFPTSALLRQLKKASDLCNKQLAIIEDPWQIKEATLPKSIINNTFNVLWFGSGLNAKYLLKEIKNIQKCCATINLKILTSSEAITYIRQSHEVKKCAEEGSIRIQYIPWESKNQPNQLEKELHQSHITLLPTSRISQAKTGISHNRLVDSVRGGCIALANEAESYLELSNVALIGADFSGMMNYTINNYQKIAAQIAKNRAATLSKFDPNINLVKWRTLLRSLKS